MSRSLRNIWKSALASLAAFLLTNPYITLRPAKFWAEFTGELAGARNPMPVIPATFLMILGSVGLLLAALIAASALLAVARRDRRAIYALIAFGLPALLLWLGRPVMCRYFLPVIPLAILLPAWAFCLVHGRGVQIGGTRARLVAPALFFILLAVCGNRSLSYGSMFSGDYEPRLEAGKYIADHIPAGSRVAVLSEPWQYDFPPLDTSRYQLTIIRPTIESLRQAAPEYVIVSDLQLPPIAVMDADESVLEFRDAVFAGRRGLSVERRFDVSASGWDFLRHGPHDLRYVNPVIIVAAYHAEKE